MTLRKIPQVLALILVCSALGPLAAADLTFDRYHRPEEIAAALQDLARANPGFAKVHVLAKSPGGRDLVLFEVGPETAKAAKTLPAVFVAADMDGTVPLSGEAALWLAKSLCDKADLRADRTWYVLACGNPDAAAGYFGKPQRRDTRNARPKNDDQDDAIDEDGPDDLDGDGLITQMRVKDPEGAWIAVPGEPRLMKKADGAKGEKGVWKLYSEGLDDDRDGQFNEDGPGGVTLATAFPHLYKYHAPDAGPWPGSEAETFALLKFFDAHREIGLAFVFGESNFCLNPPRAGRKGDADFNQIKVPERVAGFINADPTRTYSMAEIIELVKPLVPPGMEVTEGLVAGFLELGAVVNPLEDDLKFYKELSEKYKEFLKAAKLDAKRLDPAADKDGSLELYAYYHLGLPSFALDFWTPPEVKEEKPADEIDARQAREDDQRRVHRPGRGEDRRLPQGLRRSRFVQGQAGHRGAQGRHDGHEEDGRDDEADAQEAGRRRGRPEGEGPARLERQGARRPRLRRLEAVQAPDPRRGRDRRRRARTPITRHRPR